MKKLPTGIQEFSKLINENCIYVDKTEQIHKLLQYHYYFLSRPRRFGKSLLLNTIKEIFLGNRELFKGLWIYNKIDWEVYPVIKISFSNIDYKNSGLFQAIINELEYIAENHKITLKQQTPGLKFRELIEKMATEKKVVVLIDEYDKPIIDYLDKLEQAEENRDILKNFYSVIKDSDRFIKFFFVTGVSKFSKISIFSDLNNLDDITLDENFSTLLGWTQQEVDTYFTEHLSWVKKRQNVSDASLKKKLKVWYDGYSWDGTHFVYNPVSLMNFFNKRVFNNYWFSTGTPTFLMNMIREQRFTPYDIENRWISLFLLDKYDLDNISLLPLLFQTGYLTIKKWDEKRNRILLDYPNKEVAESFTIYILSELSIGKLDKTGMLLNDLIDAFINIEMDKFISNINLLFVNIPYTIIDDKEKYFHSIFYMVMKLTGFSIEAEVLTIDGRIDAVVKTDDRIFIIEFKINQSAEIAIKQINGKRYAEKYADDKRPKILLGVNFDTETRRADDYEIVRL